ncbi:single-stranded DNA-binding protein [Flavobacterium sp. I3-2]|uniref:single-stranded DNA-binding protein n=1 Tax=Flavobacterium sp. I3-2 TaxID=2748319 RepID=UPI0015AD941D|nr:single-stranded DNA-binding protein [Flavobacterium sp. I3-2]
MSTLRNSVRLIGRVGNNPEVKNFDGGKKVATLTLATNEVYYNDKNEKIETTQWHNLVAWGKVAEIIEKFVEKGKEIAIEGKLTYRNYEDKDGNKRYVTEIVVNEIVLF